jgi:hypothetical protein
VSEELLGIASRIRREITELDKIREHALRSKMLLEQMGDEVSGIRPAVISMETRQALDNFRMFRHLAHNIYTFNLDPTRIKSLIDNLPGAVDLVCQDLSLFADFLEQSTQGQA